jgi:hypothetical protein
MGRKSSPKWGKSTAPFPSLTITATICPVAADTPQGKRLDRAMAAARISRSELARRLAARPDATAGKDSLYRSIKKWIGGEAISPDYQQQLEEGLGLPPGYLYDENPTATRQRELERKLDALESRVDDALAEVRSLHTELGEALRGLTSGGRAATQRR